MGQNTKTVTDASFKADVLQADGGNLPRGTQVRGAAPRRDPRCANECVSRSSHLLHQKR